MANPVFTVPKNFGPDFSQGIINGGNLDNVLAIDLEQTLSGITAFSGGGSTTAYPLQYGYNHVSTCAANNDSVALPAAKVGASVTVMNGSTSTVAVFPQTADKINGGTAGVSITQANEIHAIYICPIANNWFRIKSA
jgi:hypothetical protein